jgi:Zn finger protein HypA/HybF involved in hydrogenase expression
MTLEQVNVRPPTSLDHLAELVGRCTNWYNNETREVTMPRDGYCPECHEYIGEDDWTECPNCGALFGSDEDWTEEV